MIAPDLRGAVRTADPFPHVLVPAILSMEQANRSLHWLREHAPWRLRTATFYEQYEVSLIGTELAAEIAPLADECFLGQLRRWLRKSFELRIEPVVVDVSAHCLVPGQSIGIHTDFRSQETHRVLVQLNSGWEPADGGHLRLFRKREDINPVKTIIPKHGSAFAFEISPRSFHAVSPVVSGKRFTVVYTLRV